MSSEVVPYMPQTEKAVNSFQASKKINDNGGLTRIFMPKYGLINERRHQLHEVVRNEFGYKRFIHAVNY